MFLDRMEHACPGKNSNFCAMYLLVGEVEDVRDLKYPLERGFEDPLCCKTRQTRRLGDQRMPTTQGTGITSCLTHTTSTSLRGRLPTKVLPSTTKLLV